MTVYGIDLGTCYSCIARDDGAGVVMPVELLSNNGKLFVPSIVYFDKASGQPRVGNVGKRALISKPECTKALVKREMDREFCEEEIIVAGKRRKISPVEASACILKHLLDGANIVETGSGRSPVTQAVITIPAKFNEKQRARTKLAAQLAGIQVLGLLNEPTAAAYAYDIPAGHTVLVFDLGGGTLDVSIVTNDKGIYKVIGTPSGDDHLGGTDWDERLIELAFQKVGLHPDRQNAKEWKDLMSKAELCKQALTDEDVVDASEFFMGSILENDVKIERSEFEAKCQDLLDRCWAVVDQAIANAKAQSPNTKIDFFLTVGGSSRMQMIRKGIIGRYGAIYGKGKSERDWLRIKFPDTAIAIGAAKYAQMQLNGQATLEDKATHSYGLEIERDGIPIIKNLVRASDPIVFSQVFKGLSMNIESESITIGIYENDIADDYADIDKGKLIFEKDVILNSKKESGTPIELSINRDKDGLIRITLTCDTVCQSFDVNPPDILIDAATKKTIKNSLSLMRTS